MNKKNHQHKESDYCYQTGKQRFRDAREATRRLHNLQRTARLLDQLGTPHRIRVKRKYACPLCKGWHLTSWGDYGPPDAKASDPLVTSLAMSTGLGTSAA